MINWIRNKIRQYRYKQAIREVRLGFRLCGHNVSGYTDKEIETVLVGAGKIIANKVGFNVKEASEAIKQTMNLLNKK